MNYKFVSLPVRPALDGVTWASLSVRMLPTEEQKQRRRLEAEQLALFDLSPPEKRPRLHPLDGRRFPIERLYFRLDRASKSGWLWGVSRVANTNDFKSRNRAASQPAPGT